jgi:hypothetical protein
MLIIMVVMHACIDDDDCKNNNVDIYTLTYVDIYTLIMWTYIH